MSDEILKSIYEITKKFEDPSTKQVFDENSKKISILVENGNVNISLIIEPHKKNVTRMFAQNSLGVVLVKAICESVSKSKGFVNFHVM